MGSCSSTMSRPAPAMQEAPATPKKASPSVAPVSPASTTAATPTKPSPPAARATPVSTLGAVTPKNVAVSGHCRHCKGLRGVCGCSEDCARPPSSQCRPMALEDLLTLISAAAGGGHCSHCRGASGECACSHGCPKSSSSASCYTTAVRLSVAANRINLILVVDKSGSMAGNRWTGVQRGVADAISRLTSCDVVTVVTFNGDVDVLGPATKDKFVSSELPKFTAMKPSGGTKLYDATAAGLVAAMKLHVAVDMSQELQTITYVVVMTDGEDNDSEVSLEALCGLVAQVNRMRNFKVLFAGIHLPDAGKRALLRLSLVGDEDVKFMDLEGSSFEKVFEHLRMQLGLVRRS